MLSRPKSRPALAVAPARDGACKYKFQHGALPCFRDQMAPPTTDVGGADTISDPQWRHPSAKGVCRRAADSGRLPSMKSSFNAPNSCYFRPSPYGACCSPEAARQGRHPAQHGAQASLVARLRPGHEHRLVRHDHQRRLWGGSLSGLTNHLICGCSV